MTVTALRDLSEIEPGRLELVGGKAAGLAELVRAGERVPSGFCLTTDAYRSGVVPEADLTAAYDAMGGGRVAVRSSATAEDLPDASFAGQQDTILGVEGAAALSDAVRRCWDSLATERAISYRETNHIDHDTVAMAVVVQRMVEASTAGVLFTANPVTGKRDEMTVDAARGLGESVVDGSVNPDHYTLGPGGTTGPEDGCLTDAQLAELRAVGTRLLELFGVPQDVEWAYDAEGTLWLLQSRAITTLFPLVPTSGRPEPRVFLNIGPFQGMHGPFTPMGIAQLRSAAVQLIEVVGGSVDAEHGPAGMPTAGGRLFIDVTAMVRGATRKGLPAQLRVSKGPRVAKAIEGVLADPRFAPPRKRPRPKPSVRIGPAVKAVARFGPPAVAGVVRGLARPVAARERAFRAAERLRRELVAPAGLSTTRDRLEFAFGSWDGLLGRAMVDVSTPISAGLIASQLPVALLKGIVGEGEVDIALRGLPHNVTTEMDLALWRLASNADQHAELLRDTPPAELTELFRQGRLPDVGLDDFLRTYGHRAAGEIDVGVPRWAEDPTPVFAALAGYLRLSDPRQAPDRRFAEASRAAEAMIDELVARAERTRPMRARLAGSLLRRAREICGLRELMKFAWIRVLSETREQLLLIGAELVEQERLDRPADVMFLDYADVVAALDGTDQRPLVLRRKADHERERRRRVVPDVVLSDGTDAETLAESLVGRDAHADGALSGMAGAPGTVSGPARVIVDPAGARLEPGEILVASSTDPGWTPLFMTAGGLVTETGGPNAHGPTVAREYGIPAVIGVRRATQEIRTGQWITVDGTAGRVLIEEASEFEDANVIGNDSEIASPVNVDDR